MAMSSHPPAPARDPSLVAAIEQRPFPELPFVPESRVPRGQHLDQVRHLLPCPRPIPEVEEYVIEIPARDGYPIPTVVYRPGASATTAGGSEPRRHPLIILYHEGGFAMGDRTDEESNARLFVRDHGAVCLNPEYRLAPEHKFPTGILDCWDVLRWAAKNAASQLGADAASAGFILGGSSAGANISSVLVNLSRRDGMQPPITGQWLSVPFLIPPELVPAQYRHEYKSMWANSTDPVLPPLSDGPDDWTTHGFVTDVVGADAESSLFSPFAKEWYPGEASITNSPSPFPRTFFQVAGLDPLRDHALVYEKVLRTEWKVPTRLVLYEGFGHMFWTNWPQMERCKDYWRDLGDGMKWLLRASGDDIRG